MQNTRRVPGLSLVAAPLCLALLSVVLPAPAIAGTVNVTQHHNNASRDGLFIDPAFTSAAAANMTRDMNFNGAIVGAVFAQPLYVENGPGGAAMVIAVTQSNNVYALNAATGSIIWQRNVGTPVSLGSLPCGNIDPLGITSTPIVDLASRSLFLDAMTTPDGGATKKHLIYSLSVDTGAIKPGWPVDVNAAVPGFDSSVQSERAALGLEGNVLYVPYGGHYGDCGSYHGRLVGVPINNPASVTTWSTAAGGGGVWGPGGVASDGTNLFVTTGNTFGTGGIWQGGEAIIRLQPGPIFSGSTTDYWAPTNWLFLDSVDADLGGSGALLVDVPGATPSALVLALGKDGKAYLLNRNNLGGITAPVATFTFGGFIIQAAATYRTALGTYVVFRPATGTLTAFRITATNPPTIVAGWNIASSGRSSPFVTSTDGTSNAIVWAVGSQDGDQRLHGYNGDTGAVVYAGGGANELMTGARNFNTGIAARGRIYLANDSKVFAFTVPTTPTPTPGPTGTPGPATPTPTPPTGTPTPIPLPTATPTATPTPTPTPAVCVLVNEGFEGTGVPPGWTTFSGAPDYHNTAAPLIGSRDLKMSASVVTDVFVQFTPQSEVNLSFAFRSSSLPVALGDFVYLVGDVQYLSILRAASGGLQFYDGTAGLLGAPTATAIPSNTLIYVFVRVVRGTGTNAIYEMEWNTVPVATGSGTRFTRVTNGRLTEQVAFFNPYHRASETTTFQFDEVRVTFACPPSTPTPTPTPPVAVNISGQVSYCSNPNPGPAPNVTLTLTGTSGGATLSDGSGHYMFASLAPGGSYMVTPARASLTPGVNSIDVVDMLAVQRHYLGFSLIPAGCGQDAADVNGDGDINAVDVLAVQRFFLGFAAGTANVGKYRFSPGNRWHPAVGGNQTGQNFDTLVLGDVASPFAGGLDDGPAQNGMRAGEVPATVAAVALPEIQPDRSGTNFTAAVTTSAIDGANKLVGFQGDFTFDERMVTFQSEPVRKAGITAGNWNVKGNILPGTGPIRTLRIAAFSLDFTPLSGSGTLFELRVARVGKAAQGTPLIWAAPPNPFIFIDANLHTQKPGHAAPGSVTRRPSKR